MKISAVYKITNAITGDFYIGSSKNVKKRWMHHKCKSTWNRYLNNQMYLDMQKYGLNKFEFQILEVVEPEELKEIEQKFIETLKPTYNKMNAKGLNVERYKEYQKSEKFKEYQKEYQKSDKYKKYKKEYNKEYQKTEKRKKYLKEYNSQLCFYNGEVLTLNALSKRFQRAEIQHPKLEAKKYLIKD